MGRSERPVDHHQAGDLGVQRGQPGGEHRAHREAGDDDARAAGGQLDVRSFGCGPPVAERGGREVLDGGAVSRQPGELDREARGAERGREAAHRLRGAGEPVDDQHAVGATGDGERFGPGQHPGLIVVRHLRIMPVPNPGVRPLRLPGPRAWARIAVAHGRRERMRDRRGLVALAGAVVLLAAGCAVVRVSVSTAGVQGNGASSTVSLAGDGSRVVFVSDASNLAPGDTNGVSDVFVRNTTTKATSLVSVATSGALADAASSDAVISASGRYVAFRSYATNLVPGAPVPAIYLRDLQDNTTTLVNHAADGSPIPLDYPGRIVISATGRFVVFVGDFKVYRYDRYAASATLVLPFVREPTGVSSGGRYLATDTVVVTGTHSLERGSVRPDQRDGCVQSDPRTAMGSASAPMASRSSTPTGRAASRPSSRRARPVRAVSGSTTWSPVRTTRCSRPSGSRPRRSPRSA